MRALGEMAVHRPVAGSFGAYAFEYLRLLAGYVVGWTCWLLMVGVGVAESTAVGIYMGFWLPGVPQWIWVVFVAFVFVMLGVEPSTRGSLVVGAAQIVVMSVICRRSRGLQAAAQSTRIALEAERA